MSYQPPPGDDGLAYGEDYSQSRGSGQGGTDRSVLGDTFKKFKSEYDKFKTPSSSGPNYGYSGSGSNQAYYGQQGQNTISGSSQPSYHGQQGQTQQGSQNSYYNPSSLNTGQPAYPGGPPTQQAPAKPDIASKLFGALQNTVQNIGSDVQNLIDPNHKPSSQYSTGPPGQTGSSYSNIPHSPGQPSVENRFDSFASEKPGNDVKWYVDGCGYFWAVSQALEAAKHSIWILDWWLSPEVYLRRPPSQNEQWRLDRTLQRAAQRGVKVHIIVYKEVTQALSKYLTLCLPKLPLHGLSIIYILTAASTHLPRSAR